MLETLSRQDNTLQPTKRPWVQVLRDVPLQSRLLGHVVIAALLSVLAWGVFPRGISNPALGGQLALPPAQSAQVLTSAVATQSGRLQDSLYLSRSAVPLTSQVIRGVLPLQAPQRSVRTSVLVYRVQPGDSTLGIAEKFGLEGNSLLWANPSLADNPDFLKVDEELNILPVDGAYHTVVANETVESIAARYKVSPDVIAGYVGNHLEGVSTLQVGQNLIIPGGVKPYVPKQVLGYAGVVPTDAQKGTGYFAWPTSGYISQRFWDGHRAIDIATPVGTPVVASDSGYVAAAQWSDVGYGRMVVIDHGNGYKTLYAHLSAYYVEVGQSVAKGETLGVSGNTGNSTGPHLHFELIKFDVRRNPMNYLP